MSRSVTFGGSTIYRPGGLTLVDTTALNQISGGQDGVVALIGEADGGAPGTIITLDDPSKNLATFTSGPLADAIPLAFQSSNDPFVPGGSSEVLCYKTNNSTQSTLNVPQQNATALLSTTATGGSTSTVVKSGATWATNAYAGSWVVVRAGTSTVELRRIASNTSTTLTLAAPVLAAAVVSTDPFVILNDEIATADALNVGSSTSTVLTFKALTATANQYAGSWVYVVDASGATYIRYIVSNTTTALTVSPALPATPTTGAYAEVLANSFVLTSEGYGIDQNGLVLSSIAAGSVNSLSEVLTLTFKGKNEASPETGGTPVLRLNYKGGAASISDTVTGTSSTTTVINLTTGGLSVNAQAGKQVAVTHSGYTEYTVIVSNTAGALTVSPALSFTPAAADTVVITAATGAAATVHGANGVATSLTTAILGVTGDDLTVPFTAGMTLRQLVAILALNTNYVVSVPNGVNQDTTLVANFDYGTLNGSLLLVSTNLQPVAANYGLYQNTYNIVTYFNSISSLVTAARATAGANDGGQKPATTTTGYQFSGGTRGTSSPSSFQAGLDALQKVRANHVVVLMDQDLVNEGYGSSHTIASACAQLAAHVAACRGSVGSERGGFIGLRGTKAQIIAQANAINDGDVQLCAENVIALNSAGSLQTFGPRMQAVMAASMRAGVQSIGEPLTHKYIRVSGITNDASWDPSDKTDATDMIKAGVLFAEKVDGKGIRWVRDLTTYVQDDNLAWSEGSVRDIVRFYAYGLRTFLVDRFVGHKAAPATIAAVKDAVNEYSEIQRQNGVIVDSTDPATGKFMKAYHNVKVTSSGDVVTVHVGFFPAPGINFVLNELFVQLATQVA